MTPSKCSNPGCKIKGGSVGPLLLLDGHQFCSEHYKAKLEADLLQKFQEWSSESKIPHRFLYLLGRVSNEFKWSAIGGSYLTAARIRDRGFDFVKTETGCTFKIVRHLNAHKLGYVTKRVTESWKADIFAKELELVGTRDFQEGDIDG